MVSDNCQTIVIYEFLSLLGNRVLTLSLLLVSPFVLLCCCVAALWYEHSFFMLFLANYLILNWISVLVLSHQLYCVCCFILSVIYF